jgi:GTPase SAR1 family protein
VVGADR